MKWTYRAATASDARKTWLCLLLLALFTCAFFYRVIFFHQALFPSTLLSGDPVWSTAGASQWHDQANNLLSDQENQFYPWRVIMKQGFGQGILPQWNPYAGAGYPFLGAMQPGVLYPLNLLMLLVSPAYAGGLRAALSLFLASAGMLLYLRALRLSHIASLFGALTFGYCQFNVAWTGYNIGAVVIWLPWLFLAVESLMISGSLLWSALLAAIWATSLLGGHPESSLHVALLLGAYSIFRLVRMTRTQGHAETTRAAARLVSGLILGAGIAAIQLLPLLRYLPSSIASATRPAWSSISLITLRGEPQQWLTAIAAIIPGFFGNPSRATYWLSVPWTNYNTAAMYAGVTATLLVLTFDRSW